MPTDSRPAVTASRRDAAHLLLAASFLLASGSPAAAQPVDIRSSFYGGRPVTYQVIGGVAIYQGDIVLGTADELEAARDRAFSGGVPNTAGGFPVPHASTIAYGSSLWPIVSGVAHVPYTISATTQTNAAAVSVINVAIANSNATFPGVIQWVAHTTEADFVTFDLTLTDHSGSCASNVGRAGGQQSIVGSVDCGTVVIMHEMGHSVGLWHEQSRRDRNTFVNVLTANIDKPRISNFDQQLSNEVDLGLYDYASLMHYAATLFSKYGSATTLESIPAGIPLTNQTGFSAGDVDAVQRLYGQTPTSVTIDSNPSGASVIVDGNTVVTPQTFAWPLNSTHTLDVPANPVTLSGAQLGIFGRWSDSAGATAAHTITVTPGNGAPYSPSTAPAATVYVANFIPIYQFGVNLNSFHGGTVTNTPPTALTFAGKKYYTNRQLVTLQANPSAGHGFSSWANLSTFNLFANPNVLNVGSAMPAVAPIDQAAPALTLASSAPGIPATGVAPAFAITVDGSSTNIPQSLAWTAARSLNGAPLNPSPVTTNITYAFGSWSDGGSQTHSVIPAGVNQTLTLNLTPSFRAIVTPTPSCAGTVGPAADQFVQNGTLVSYSATANSGFTFVGWGGDLTGIANPQGITVNDQLLATANFNLAGTTDPLALTSVAPASAVVTAGAVDVVILGTGLTGSSQVFWNGLFRTSTFNSSTQLTVHLQTGDLALASFNQIFVQNISSACGPFATIDYRVTATAVPPQLTISKTHTGNFTQGQASAPYTVTVTNGVGAATTSGTVTVTETPPTGLTLVSMSGTGWICAGNTCTRLDPLAGGASYPAITVLVNVAGAAASPLVNAVNVSGGGSVASDTTDSTILTAAPVLGIAKSHVGNFVRGQIGAIYTVTVANSGSLATTGTVTVTETVPSGLTLTSMTGAGWSCVTNTCDRTDALGPAASYPDITVTVDVASNATSPQGNVAGVAGGGSAPANFRDNTVILSPAGLIISKTHTGAFGQGQNGATYTVTVSNATGATATAGTVTVTETVPAGLTLVSMAGTGWTCVTNTCTRSDALAGGSSYSTILVTVNVAANATSPQVNSVGVSGGTSPSANATDSTVVLLPTSLTIAKNHAGNFLQGQTTAAYTVTVSNTVGTGTTSGTVTVTETVPAGLTLVSMTGTGWVCVTNSCTRSDALAGGLSYPVLNVTVSVASDAASPQVNSVSVSGGGSATANATDSTVITPVALLSIAKSHAGNFFQGQAGATYTLTVSDAIGSGDTAGTVQVTDNPPAGLSAVSLTGTGWTCGASTCTRSDALAGGSSYPPITLTVNVASNAPATLVNSAKVTGGGSVVANTTDSTNITPIPLLKIVKSHAGNVFQGSTVNYSVTVSNTALSGPTSGAVTVTETAPAGMSLVFMAGSGWTCLTNTCTRSDTLAGGSSYPAITATVSVAPNATSPQVNSVGVSGGGSVSASATDSTAITAVPLLTVASSHAASFSQSQTGATYTVTVSNSAGSATTSGTVTVTESLPAGLTFVSMAGTGWLCPNTACTRADALAGGASYPAITVTVNVASNATSPLLNSVTVSGGGSVSSNATDSTLILTPPILSITKTHTGDFLQGQTSAAYTVTVSNASGALPTSGAVTVTDTVPAGLSLVSLSGAGWNCAGNTCTRGDVLASGTSYPAIAATVNVALTATSPQVNTVSVSGGGSATANAGDSTNIIPIPLLSISKVHAGNFTQGQGGVTYLVTVSNTAATAPTNGTVTVTEAVPSGLTGLTMSGTGWTCGGATCTRGDPLAAQASYPAITVTVNVAGSALSLLINQVSVSGGGSPNAGAVDPTSILPFTCDINGDQATNVADVQLIINEALGLALAVNDLTHDGLVTVADVQKLINAVLGLGCPY